MATRPAVRLILESLEERLVLDSSLMVPKSAAAALVSAALVQPSTLGAEQVLRWNNLALQAIAANKTAPPLAARQLAILSVAMYDAANGISHNGSNSLMPGHAPRGANIDVAVATAAQRVLTSLFPGQKAWFAQEYQLTLSQVKRGMSLECGQAWGTAVANRILQERKNDGASAVVPYTPTGLPGRWVPTPPAFVQNPLLPQWAGVKPFALTSASQFRPVAPPSISSPEYAAELNEVKDLGAVNSLTRTADQTQIAKFWAAGAGTVTPPGMWNVFAQQLARDNHLSTTETARLLAVLNVAQADAGIACWDAKYVYDYWRPVTAIRNADLDNNADTTKDATWSSLLGTPPFPTYTSGHSTFSAAAAEVLSAFFGANIAFSGLSDGLPGVTRGWTSFRAAAVEAGDSRIYGGIHFRFDSVEGIVAGKQVGQVALQRFGLQAAPGV